MRLVYCESQGFVPPVFLWMDSRRPTIAEASPACLRAREQEWESFEESER